MNRNNVSFGEFWEFSRLINYKVQKDIYWKRKLNKKIQRAFFLRDYKSLAALIQHCYNLRTKNESVYCSTGMILLMSNISLLKYHDGEYVSIFMEYNRKFSKRLKSEERELIRDICKKQNYTRLAKKFLEELKRRIRYKNFAIEDVSDLRGYLSIIKVEPETNVNGMIKLLRKDPCIDIDLTKIYKELEKEDVELYELTREIVSRLSPQCSEKKISVALSGEPVFCHGIRQILDEMIYNITENAIKYNRDGGSVSVWVGNTLDGPKISVSDTGIGIPEEHQERIFERFYRVDKSHSKERGGTGLGLSIVKHGAILHGAKVTVNSEPGKGTKIEIRFPKEEKMKKAEVL